MAGKPDWQRMPPVDFDEPKSVTVVRVLGHGRAAEARLVTAHFPSGRSLVCVEKVFLPGLLTRLIYRLAFQAPFAYQISRDAVLACFYRRRVAAALIEMVGLDVQVSRPLYVRFDRSSQAFVLGTQWIDGRGIVPAKPDRFRVRRAWERLLRRAHELPPRPPQEIDQLLNLMRQLEGLLCESGLVGTGWQVCTRAMVSTANLLRTEAGYVAIDLESGIPAVLVPRYLRHSLRLRAFPMFDDLDETTLRGWVDRHAEQIGIEGRDQFSSDVEQLIKHTKAWKQAEPALGRNALSFLRRENRHVYGARCLETWRLCGDVDGQTILRIRSGHRRLFQRLFVLGLIPGPAGKFFQRLVGNREYRDSVDRFWRESPFRREQIRALLERKSGQWAEAGRLPTGMQLSHRPMLCAVHGILAICTPRGLHRWLTDRQVRLSLRDRALLMIVSRRFQCAYGRHLIRLAIHSWELAGRLTTEDAAQLRAQSDSTRLQEYAQCFGLHLGLKLFDPLIYPVKIAGMAAFVRTGNPAFLLALFLLPGLRTLITLSRMFSRERPQSTEYGEALIIGALPSVGSLAFPVQMSVSCPELSAFLLRDAAARVGRSLPIYGGKDSRIEIGAIRLMDFVIGFIDILAHTTRAIRRRFSLPVRNNAAAPKLVPSPRRWWDRLVDDQLQQMAAAETAAWGGTASDSPPEQSQRHAA